MSWTDIKESEPPKDAFEVDFWGYTAGDYRQGQHRITGYIWHKTYKRWVCKKWQKQVPAYFEVTHWAVVDPPNDEKIKKALKVADRSARVFANRLVKHNVKAMRNWYTPTQKAPPAHEQ